MATATQPVAASPYALVPRGRLRESPLNTRKLFNPASLEQLALSLRTSGMYTPILARPNARLGTYKGEPVLEIGSGHRRYRASGTVKIGAETLAEIAEVPVIVREMSDAEFLELITIDNLQREDVHPLEEAQGYKNLLTLDGYNAAKIAERIKKSESYVWDRLKLLQLIPRAQKYFLANRFSAGHAILIARLSTEDQGKVITPTGALWEGEGDAHPALGVSVPEDDESTELAGLKPISVRELQAWIDNHIRFTGVDESTPHLFEETADNLTTAEEAGVKVVHISRDHQLRIEARDPKGGRTYGVKSWQRADGQPEIEDWSGKEKPSKTCDHSVMGLVVAGRGRGESFAVCVDRDKCLVHYGDVIRQRNARMKARASEKSRTPTKPSEPKEEPWERDRRLREARAAKVAARWEKGGEAVLGAIAAKLKKMLMDSKGAAGAYLWALLEDGTHGLDDYGKIAAKHGITRGSSAGDLMRYAIMCDLIATGEPDTYRGESEDQLQKALGRLKLKVNVKQLLDAANPEPKKEEEKKPAAKSAKKKAK